MAQWHLHCECPLGKDYSKNPSDNSFPKYQGQDLVRGRLLVLPNKADLECYARENTTFNAYWSYKLKITNLWLKKRQRNTETTKIKQSNKLSKAKQWEIWSDLFLFSDMSTWVSLKTTVLHMNIQRHSQGLMKAFGQTLALIKSWIFICSIYIWGKKQKLNGLVPKIHSYNLYIAQLLWENPTLVTIL